MSREIRPLTPEDIVELGRFLAAGFHTTPDADFAAPEVLRWKYLDGPGIESLFREGGSREGEAPAEPVFPGCAARQEPRPPTSGTDSKPGATGPEAALSYVARDDSGRIIGHLGLCRTAFEGRALSAAGGRVATIHIIDWLGSPEHKAVGMSLMRRAHSGVATQFGLGVSQAALVVGERAGYDLRSLVPVYTRVLRASYWLRAAGLAPWRRALATARDIGYRLIRRPAVPRTVIVPRRVSSFGPEIVPIVEAAKERAILTTRDPARLNAFLRFPRQAMSGWHLLDGSDRLRGLAVLNIIPKDGGRTRTGKVVDCLLDDVDADAWHAAFLALTRELMTQGADLAQAYGSTPWATEALGRSGFSSRFAVKFHIRDREGLIPKDVTFHLTPLEGDYGYT
jgi:hypothetical protein